MSSLRVVFFGSPAVRGAVARGPARGRDPGAPRRHAAGPAGGAAAPSRGRRRWPRCRGVGHPRREARAHPRRRGFLARLAAAAPDAIAVVAYGRILPPAILELPRSRLRQRPRVAAAQVPRRVADPGGAPRRRRGDRSGHDAHRGRARRGPALPREARGDRSARDGGGALASGCRRRRTPARRDAARPRGRDARGTASNGRDLVLPADPAGGRRGRLDACPPRRSRGGCARTRPGPGLYTFAGDGADQDPGGASVRRRRGRRRRAGRVRVSSPVASSSPRAAGGALELLRVQRAGRGPVTGAELARSLARLASDEASVCSGRRGGACPARGRPQGPPLRVRSR